MTTVAYPMGSADNDQITLTLHYDDQTLLILDVTADDLAGKWPVTFTAYSKGLSGQPPAGTVIYGPKTYSVVNGETVDNLLSLNLHMVHDIEQTKFGQVDNITTPYSYSFEG